MDKVLQERVAVITGAGRGMGRAYAEKLASMGAHVVIQDLDGGAAEEAVAEMRARELSAEASVGDVTRIAAYRASLRALEARLGRIDILVNNAGISGRSLALEDIDEGAFDQMFDVNVRASFFGTAAVVPGMKARKWGRIVNVSSIFSMRGSPNASHYTGAKSALLGLTKSWALELAPWNICINALAPGLIKTAMTVGNLGEAFIDAAGENVPLGRLATADDTAEALAYLVGPSGNAVTGQTLSVNAGDTIVGI